MKVRAKESESASAIVHQTLPQEKALPFDNDIGSCQRARLLSLIDEKGSNSKLQLKADKDQQQTRKTYWEPSGEILEKSYKICCCTSVGSKQNFDPCEANEAENIEDSVLAEPECWQLADSCFPASPSSSLLSGSHQNLQTQVKYSNENFTLLSFDWHLFPLAIIFYSFRDPFPHILY